MSDWLLNIMDGSSFFFFFKSNIELEKVRDIQDVYPTELILKSPSVSMVRAGLNMIYNTSAT